MRLIVGIPPVLAFVLLPFWIAFRLAMLAVRSLWRLSLFVALLVEHPAIMKEAGTRLAGAAVLVASYYFAVWFWNL